MTDDREDENIPCNLALVAESLRTCSSGQTSFLLESSGHYVVKDTRHPDYPSLVTAMSDSVNCSLDQCQSCSLALVSNLTKSSCSTAKLYVHVRDQLDEPIVGANVSVYLGTESLDSLVTGQGGEVELEVQDQSTYRVRVQSVTRETLERSVSVSCSPDNCTDCSGLVTFSQPLVTTLSCPNASLTLVVKDSVTHKSPSEQVVTVTYSSLPDCSPQPGIQYQTELGTTQRLLQTFGESLQDEQFSPQQCRNLCRSLQNCFFYTWRSNSCWFQDRITSRTTEEGSISGPAYCPWGETDEVPLRCTGEDNDCCSDLQPCGLGQGDCDTDSQCADSLVCGSDNCHHSRLLSFDLTDDCCEASDDMSIGLLVEDRISSLAKLDIDQNGLYSITISAPGYQTTTKNVEFNCSVVNCSNCSQSLTVDLKQVFCENTFFEIVVTDFEKPVVGAQVSLFSPPPVSTTWPPGSHTWMVAPPFLWVVAPGS